MNDADQRITLRSAAGAVLQVQGVPWSIRKEFHHDGSHVSDDAKHCEVWAGKLVGVTVTASIGLPTAENAKWFHAELGSFLGQGCGAEFIGGRDNLLRYAGFFQSLPPLVESSTTVRFEMQLSEAGVEGEGDSSRTWRERPAMP